MRIDEQRIPLLTGLRAPVKKKVDGPLNAFHVLSKLWSINTEC